MTTYIGGHTFINVGAEKDESIPAIIKTAAEMKAFIAKHDLQDITVPHNFWVSRQIIGMKNRNPEKAQQMTAEYETFRPSRQVGN